MDVNFIVFRQWNDGWSFCLFLNIHDESTWFTRFFKRNASDAGDQPHHRKTKLFIGVLRDRHSRGSIRLYRLHISRALAIYIIAAAAIYIFACVLSTALFNVPLNNLLERADAETDEGRCLWRDYLSQWTNWNHLRSFACVLSTILLAYSLSEIGGL